MSMKKTLALATMFAAMAMGNSSVTPLKETETPQERENRLRIAQDKLNRDKGLNEFYYGKTKVWALNQKAADKKAKRLGLI